MGLSGQPNTFLATVATEGRCKDVLAELCKAILTAAVGDGKSSDCNFMVSYMQLLMSFQLNLKSTGLTQNMGQR